MINGHIILLTKKTDIQIFPLGQQQLEHIEQRNESQSSLSTSATCDESNLKHQTPRNVRMGFLKDSH